MGRPYLKMQTSFLASVTYYKNTKSESHWKVPWYLAKFLFLGVTEEKYNLNNVRSGISIHNL